MTFELKTLSPESVPRALAKAERYRLLNEPGEAESICLDALQVDADNQEVLAMLLLALTDQFDDDLLTAHDEAVQVAARLRDEYERAYYTGIIWERRAKARLRRASPAVFPHVYGWLREAMVWYEKAEAIRPPGNDDAVLRWNTCARIFMHNTHLQPREEETAEPYLE